MWESIRRLVPGGHFRLEFTDPSDLDRAAHSLGDGARDDDALTLQIASDGSLGALRDLLDRLDAEAIPVAALSVHTPDLDDVFLTLTDR